MNFDGIGRLGFFNHERMVEDLLSIEPLLADISRSGRIARPPEAVLARLGDDMLNATEDDLGAWSLKQDDELIRSLDRHTYGMLEPWGFKLSWYVAAICLGRRDLRSQFTRSGRFDPLSALRWFVLYGIREHRLYGFLNRRFVEDLITQRQVEARYRMSLLQYLVVLERPDLFPVDVQSNSERFQSQFDAWLIAEGVHEYGLFWCLRQRELIRFAESDASLRRAVPDAADTNEALRRYLFEGAAARPVDMMAASPEAFSALLDPAGSTRQQPAPALENPLSAQKRKPGPSPLEQHATHLRFGLEVEAAPYVNAAAFEAIGPDGWTAAGPIQLKLPHPGHFAPFTLVVELQTLTEQAGVVRLKLGDKTIYGAPTTPRATNILKFPIARRHWVPDPYLSFSIDHLGESTQWTQAPTRARLKSMWLMRAM